MDDLKIHVGSDVLDVTKSLSTLEKEFKDLQKTIAKSTDGKEVVQLNKRLDDLGATMKAIKTAGKVGFDDFGQKIGAIKKPVGDASNALMNFGRIAQDAPFGIIGITNNINPALESFQRLQKETGSTGAALKALVSGLAGPAGVGIAVAGLSSLLTGVTLKYGSLNNALKEWFGNMTDAQRVTQEFNKSFAQTAGSDLTQIDRLNSLLKVARDVNASYTTRKNAVDEINRSYPEFNNNLTVEKANTEKVNEQIAKQILLLQLQAKQKAVQSVLEKKYQQELENNTKPLEEQLSFMDVIVANLKKMGSMTGGVGAIGKMAEQGTKNYEKQNLSIQKQKDLLQEQLDAVTKSIAEINGFKTDTGHVSTEIKKTIQYLQQGLTPVEVPIKFKDDLKKKGIELKEVFHGIESVGISKSFGGKSIFDRIFKDGKVVDDASVEAFNNFKEFWEKENAKDPLKIKVNVDLKNSKPIDPSAIIDNAKTQEAEKKAQDFSDRISDIIKAGLTDAFIAVGEGLGTIIADGSKGLSAFANVGIALANILTQVGKAAIETGLSILAIKLSIKTLNPYLAIAAGVALTALGTVIKSKLGKVGTGMATGGIVPAGFPNDTFPARLSSNEAVIPLDRIDSLLGDRSFGGGGILTARVSGSDLLFVLDRTGRAQKRGGFNVR